MMNLSDFYHVIVLVYLFNQCFEKGLRTSHIERSWELKYVRCSWYVYHVLLLEILVSVSIHLFLKSTFLGLNYEIL